MDLNAQAERMGQPTVVESDPTVGVQTQDVAVEPDLVVDAETRPERRQPGWMVPIGILIGLFGTAGAGLGAVVALFTANSCGAFADGCETYGRPAPGFYPAVGLFLLCGAVAVAGLVMMAVGVSASVAQRRRSSDS